MMIDYTKQCWSCKKVTMVNKGDYFQCSVCGATWNVTPKLDFSPLAAHGFCLKDNEGTVLSRVQRPSKTVTRRARKKRGLSWGDKQ